MASKSSDSLSEVFLLYGGSAMLAIGAVMRGLAHTVNRKVTLASVIFPNSFSYIFLLSL